MKIFVLLSRFPYPLEKGDKLRAYHQIKTLSENHEIILCCISDKKIKKEWKNEVNKICSELHVFELSKPLIYWNTVKQIFTDKPFQVGYFFQRAIDKKIRGIIKSTKPDHIYCQLIRVTEYVKNIHTIPKTLDYMDALSKGMYRRGEIARGIKKVAFLKEGKRLAEYEHRIYDYFNHHTIISEQDRNLINHPSKNQINIIENGISSDFTSCLKKNQVKSHELVFTGNMNYPPNIECSLFIVNEILPLLIREKPQIKLLLSGANPHPKIQELNKNKNVTVTGWVEDIRDSYAKGKLFVAPLFIGTGLQNKLLEAMAMGLPVVTTSLANNALKAKPQKEVIIAKTAKEFSEEILNLLKNKTHYQEIANNGFRYVEERYNWKNSVEKLEKLLTS
ncbi:glycosyltransferase [Crocinitomix algicola]|uniref:glycosyltransferase n=1 Tax=Crocinitomix algicola TaxID=1740263 RepID=UPI00082AD687|nr:glycosyltransferase [Crocinitomix algicola]